MTMKLPTTTAAMRAMLKKAGFDYSTSTTTRIRGYRNYSNGMTVKDAKRNGYICKINYFINRDHDRAAAKLDEIEKLLQALGFTVLRGGEYNIGEHTHTLWVQELPVVQ